MILSVVSFGVTLANKDVTIIGILSSLLITVFTMLFGAVAITYKRNSKTMILVSGILLIVYFFLQFNNQVTIVQGPILTAPNFSGKSITAVMKWADKNKIIIEQEYEYSDMVPEYSVISQNILAGTAIQESDTIIISVSEGPNPSKEIMVPNMMTWDADRVLHFIEENHMSNVLVDFEQSDKAKNTVISQSASGSLKRNDELKLVFSQGEELGFSEVTLEDLTGKSEFEVVFYMKQNQLNYAFEYDFHKKVKKGFVISQNVEAGEKVGVHDKIIGVTISKGPEIKIPDFTDYTMTKVAEWAIQNRVKISFEDEYHDTVKENQIIRSNYNVGDIIEQGTVVKIIISRGSLKMPKIKSISDFYDWANRYNIRCEEKHEFSDKVPAGEVISYSHKAGEVIKSDDTVVITISDGAKRVVPNVVGMTKKEATNKMNAVGLNMNFTYRNSSETKDKVLSQSIRAGSEVSSGTTVTIVLSNGKKESNNGSGNNPSTNPTPDPTPDPDPEPPTPQCNSCTITGIRGIVSTNIDNGFQAVANALKSEIQAQCPGISVTIVGDDTSGESSGTFLGGFKGGNVSSCDTISITLAK